MHEPLVRIGIGGWTFEPWRGTFYPPGLPHSQELAHASRHLSAIEINGTYYSTQKPSVFAKWRDETPENFVFSLKASRFATNRRELAGGADAITRFIDSGITELGPKLGPIVWQFAPTKAFDPYDFEAFLALLPDAYDGHTLRHVVDVRHPSFMSREFLALAREYRTAVVFTDSDDYPSFADLTADLVYARLMRTDARRALGFTPAQVDQWARRARIWQGGGEPDDLPRVAEKPKARAAPRDVFLFVISGAKEKAPAAAQALIAACA